MRKLLIVDGHSLAYRCYYAQKNTANGLIVNADGVPITICSGFLRSLNKLLKKHKPNYLVICFDAPGKTWRHQLYPAYKGNRQKNPQEQINIQIEIRNLQGILVEKEIATYTTHNLEADDRIADMSNFFAINEAWEDKPNLEVIISSTDKDLLQLVDDDLNIKIDSQLGKKEQIYTEREVLAEYGIYPVQIADYKAIVGDSSDNIPGVVGIGKKGAVELLTNYKNIHNILDNIHNLPPKHRKKIEVQKNNLLLYFSLIKLQTAKLNAKYFLDELKEKNLNKFSSIAKELGIENVTNTG